MLKGFVRTFINPSSCCLPHSAARCDVLLAIHQRQTPSKCAPIRRILVYSFPRTDHAREHIYIGFSAYVRWWWDIKAERANGKRSPSTLFLSFSLFHYLFSLFFRWHVLKIPAQLHRHCETLLIQMDIRLLTIEIYCKISW